MKNKGFTLVEMVIVIVIIAVIGVVVSIGVNFSLGRAADKAAEEIVSVLREAQSVSMSKYETIVTITESQGQVIAVLDTKDSKDSAYNTETFIICDSSVEIAGIANGFRYEFDRTNGGLKVTPGSDIVISKSGNSKRVRVVAKTGNITVE